MTHHSAALDRPASPSAAVANRWRRIQIRAGLAVYRVLVALARRVGPRQRPVGAAGCRVLLTGTFHSDNWIRAHVAPLAASRGCAGVTMVASVPLPPLPGVRSVVPPNWLVRLAGRLPARLLVFATEALRTRPDVIGGFHLLVNGLAALLLGRIVGARALYFCVGGPVELLGGGVWGGNKFFAKIGTPDERVERALLDAVRQFDLIVTMGTRARSFFEARGVRTHCHVIPGGIDAGVFNPSPAERVVDLILVARLVPIKRIDLFLHAVRCVADAVPGVAAVIVGDGPLRASLERLARELGIERRVTFTGHSADVQAWLRQSKIFVLTSDSEGLALSLMEAMCSGLPAVVRRVGDLEDMVEEGVNGHLVASADPVVFAERFRELLLDAPRLARFAEAARATGQRHTTAAAARAWDTVWPAVTLQPSAILALSRDSR